MGKDTIYRQDAIDAIRAMQTYKLFAGDDLILVDQAGAQTELMMLPSAQPRMKGRWIDYTDDGYVECPFCGSATNCDGNISELHYCFSCGADLKGGEKRD